MKMTCDPLTPCLLAALCLALQGAGTTFRAQTDDPQMDEDEQMGEQIEEQTGEQRGWECRATDEPTAYNKASCLIGARVQNQAGQSLGRIKDIVIDGQSERVSYAVLAVRHGFLGLRQKLLAVPFNAFSPTDNGRRLVLNADRSSLARAEGFPSNQWPSPTAPSWGAAPPWKEGFEPPETDDNLTQDETSKRTTTEEPEGQPADPNPPGSLGWPGW
jgi:sporulation protein YlmC with PRC-barrel domain